MPFIVGPDAVRPFSCNLHEEWHDDFRLFIHHALHHIEAESQQHAIAIGHNIAERLESSNRDISPNIFAGAECGQHIFAAADHLAHAHHAFQYDVHAPRIPSFTRFQTW